VPVVRRTGGLNDTVFDVDHDAERAAAAGFPTNGFSFDGIDAAGIDYALNRRAPLPTSQKSSPLCHAAANTMAHGGCFAAPSSGPRQACCIVACCSVA
jgi:glycogen synthase